MTQEEKQLLLKDLCARLPYGIKVQAVSVYDYTVLVPIDGYCSSNNKFDIDLRWRTLDEFKPYLRPMSSMTEEERTNLRRYCRTQEGIIYNIGVTGAINSPAVIDFLLAHHFDYRGLIEKGLALEAKEGMYKTE